MDHLTSVFYADYAAALPTNAEAPRSAMLPHVERCFMPGDFVLDVGAGSGRDVSAMLARGIEAFGVEPHTQMREHALATYPHLQDRLRAGALPDLGRPFSDVRSQGFDGVICSAVLMHVAPSALPEALSALAGQLRRAPPDADPGATAKRPALLISIPAMDEALLRDDRDNDGRLFHNHAPTLIARLLSRHGLTLHAHDTSDAVLASAGTRWHTLLLR